MHSTAKTAARVRLIIPIRLQLALRNCLLSLFILVLAVVCSSCCGIPPPPPLHLPKSMVNVAYIGPQTSPDRTSTYFVKIVTQEREKYIQRWYWFDFLGWEKVAFRKWNKVFLCRSEHDGTRPEVLCEIFYQQYPDNSESIRPLRFADWHTVVGFDVSWTKKHAVIVLDQWHENTKDVDLLTKRFSTRTIGDPESRGFTGFRDLKLQLIEDESIILWSAWGSMCGTLDFEGKIKSINLQKLGKYEFYFGLPLWSPEHQLIVVDAGTGGRREDLWLFDKDLQLIGMVESFEEFSREYKRTGKINHPYAWAIEQYWHYRWDKKQPSEPSPFNLKTHTIEHKRIDPDKAATLW